MKERSSQENPLAVRLHRLLELGGELLPELPLSVIRMDSEGLTVLASHNRPATVAGGSRESLRSLGAFEDLFLAADSGGELSERQDRILGLIAELAADAVRVDAETRALSAVRESLDAQLGEAASYVEQLLPPPFRDDEVQTDWRFIPSAELGGDALGFRWLDRRYFSFYILDVSGHGIGSSLFAVTVLDVLRNTSLRDTDFTNPQSVLRALNRTFPMSRQGSKYFTIWYGVFDREQRELIYASAGHPPALLIAENGVEPLGTSGPMIGASQSGGYRNVVTAIPAGGRVLLATDGLSEFKKPGGDRMSPEELQRLIADGVGEKSLLDYLLEQVRWIRGSDRYDDDVSLLLVDFT